MYEYLSGVFQTNAAGTVLLTNLFFIVFFVLIVYLAMHVAGADEDGKSRSVNLLVAMLGGLVGWGIGTLFSAFSPSEKALFGSISSTVGVFLSGYVVSKIDRFVEGALFPIKDAHVAWSRLGLFTAALLLAAIAVFINRLYAFQVSGVESSHSSSIEALAVNSA